LIRSRRNPRIVQLGRLHRPRQRRRTGKTLIEGPHLLAEALAAGHEVPEVLAVPADHHTRGLCERYGVAVTSVTGEVLSRLAGTKNPRGPVAVLGIPRPDLGGKDVLWLLVSEPGNCGSLIRTASAFGWDVAMGDMSVDPWSPKVLRAGAGGHFRAAISGAAEAPPEALVVGSVPRGGVPLPQMGDHLDSDRPWWLIIGDEAGGIHSSYGRRVDLWCSIPMPGKAESLNAAAAGAIICQHLSGIRGNRNADSTEQLGNLSKLL